MLVLILSLLIQTPVRAEGYTFCGKVTQISSGENEKGAYTGVSLNLDDDGLKVSVYVKGSGAAVWLLCF